MIVRIILYNANFQQENSYADVCYVVTYSARKRVKTMIVGPIMDVVMLCISSKRINFCLIVTARDHIYYFDDSINLFCKEMVASRLIER